MRTPPPNTGAPSNSDNESSDAGDLMASDVETNANSSDCREPPAKVLVAASGHRHAFVSVPVVRLVAKNKQTRTSGQEPPDLTEPTRTRRRRRRRSEKEPTEPTQRIQPAEPFQPIQPAEPTQRMKQVSFYSIGAENLGLEKAVHQPDFMHLVEQKFREMQRDIKPDFFIDVVSLKRLSKSEPLHIGEHIANLECLDQHIFRQAIRRVRAALDACAGSQEDMNVIVVCRQGRHRSVAASKALAEVAARRTPHNIKGPFHLSRGNWHKRLCYRCTGCSAMAEEKNNLFEAFATWW